MYGIRDNCCGMHFRAVATFVLYCVARLIAILLVVLLETLVTCLEQGGDTLDLEENIMISVRM